jgi:transcription antitermination factor NusB
MKSLRGSRRLAREKVLQIFAAATAAQVPWDTVFEHIFYRDFTVDIPTPVRPLLTPEELQEVEADTPIHWEEDELRFARQLLEAAERFREVAAEALCNVLQHWDIERLVPIDRLILQLGIAEMLAFPQTPVPVVIDEAVELAKKYSTEHSGQFVNGVLEAAYYWLVERGLRAPSPEMRPRTAQEALQAFELPQGYNAEVFHTLPGSSGQGSSQ